MIKNRSTPEFPEYQDGFKILYTDGTLPIPQQNLFGANGAKPSKPKPSGRGKEIPPPIEELNAFGKELGVSPEQCEKFFNHYTANGWKQGNKGKPIVDWKAALRNWKSNIGMFAASKNVNIKTANDEKLLEDKYASINRNTII